MKIKTKKQVSTYMPVLIKSVLLTSGPVLELGAGVFSTPLLHWLCAENRRPLLTLEKDPEYLQFAKKFTSRTHRIKQVDDWTKIDTKTHWSVVLVDQESKRAETAILLKRSADFIVLHDSEHEKHYQYDQVYPHFKYIYHWQFCSPFTTVVSNFNDLEKLKNAKLLI